MKDIFDHPLVQFFITIIAIMAGFVLVKTMAGYLPESNSVSKAVRKVLLSA